MVSKKKRPPPALESTDTVPKKSKVYEDAGTSGTSVAANTKSSKRKNSSVPPAEIKMDIEPEDIQVANKSHDFPDWPQADLVELMKRIESNIPMKDTLKFDSRIEKLDWDAISFGVHTGEECKETWTEILKRLRKFRLLKEVLEDAKEWVSKPWTHFYRSQKMNRHPDLPRRPLSTYMLFYLEKKDKVTKENPGLEMTTVSKHIAEMYKNLPAKRKQKYIEMAASERKAYDEKLLQFYQAHPDLLPKRIHGETRNAVEIGPKKPKQPFKLFFEDKMKRHKSEPNFDKAAFLEKCKKQWRDMADKKKVIWINWALEEESRYLEELKAYMSENPEFVPANIKTVLTKEEKNLKERVAGKPDKPPNSGYSLFSRVMLNSPMIKGIAPKERMIQISRLWKCYPENLKKDYQERVNHMLDQYKLEYATYLESLPEDKRQEELQNNLPKPRKNVKTKVNDQNEGADKKDVKTQSDGKTLYKGEPEPPPRNEYELFLKTLKSDKSLGQNEKTAPNVWQMLPESDKTKYRKELSELKAKYIEDYEKFLNSLSQDELKIYSAQKETLKKDAAESSDESAEESNASDDEEEEESAEESGSEDSSSDSDSGSSDTSESDDGDSKNSEDSSSSGSDSE